MSTDVDIVNKALEGVSEAVLAPFEGGVDIKPKAITKMPDAKAIEDRILELQRNQATRLLAIDKDSKARRDAFKAKQQAEADAFLNELGVEVKVKKDDIRKSCKTAISKWKAVLEARKTESELREKEIQAARETLAKHGAE